MAISQRRAPTGLRAWRPTRRCQRLTMMCFGLMLSTAHCIGQRWPLSLQSPARARTIGRPETRMPSHLPRARLETYLRLGMRLPRQAVSVTKARHTLERALAGIGVRKECRDDITLALSDGVQQRRGTCPNGARVRRRRHRRPHPLRR
jgi:hypothetical protein